MALNAAEEETLDSLKQWWDENGKGLVAMVIVVLASYTGWLLWQNNQTATANAASDLYQEILTIAVGGDGVPNPDADSARIRALADELRADYSSTTYAQFGALFAAQQAVAEDDLDAAEDYLRWVLENQQDGLFSDVDEGMILTTNLRLGRVILAQGDTEGALSLVNSVDPKTFEAGYAELRGDIYVAMGRDVDARESYIAAQQAGSNSQALRMKLDNLGSES